MDTTSSINFYLTWLIKRRPSVIEQVLGGQARLRVVRGETLWNRYSSRHEATMERFNGGEMKLFGRCAIIESCFVTHACIPQALHPSATIIGPAILFRVNCSALRRLNSILCLNKTNRRFVFNQILREDSFTSPFPHIDGLKYRYL